MIADRLVGLGCVETVGNETVRLALKKKRDGSLGGEDLVLSQREQPRVCLAEIRLVLDNLNTHTGASLYKAFAPAIAKTILDRLDLHYTPKHASWLNIAEIGDHEPSMSGLSA